MCVLECTLSTECLINHHSAAAASVDDDDDD